jgi:hypothetical protein
VSWHSACLLGRTVSGTDFGDRMGVVSGRFAESALDTLCVARNGAYDAGFGNAGNDLAE